MPERTMSTILRMYFSGDLLLMRHAMDGWYTLT